MAMNMPCLLLETWSWRCHGYGHVIAKADVVAKAIILEKVKGKALSFSREMSLAKVSDSGWGDGGLKIINLRKILCRTWYEVGGEDGMKLGMNKAKIFGRQPFMAIDDFYDYGYRFPLSSERWLLKGHLSTFDQSEVKKTEVDKLTQIRRWNYILLQALGEIEGMEW